MATTSTKTDVNIRIEGSIVLFWNETAEAVAWWAENVNDEAPFFCGAHVVEHRYAQPIIEGLVAEGFILSNGGR